jgi:soluble lytic murein transglycosylase
MNAIHSSHAATFAPVRSARYARGMVPCSPRIVTPRPHTATLRAQRVARWPLLCVLALLTMFDACAAPRLSARLQAMQDALAAAQAGRLDPARAARLAGDPLAAWLDFARLTTNLQATTPAAAQGFLDRNAQRDPAAVARFRPQWLRELARRGDDAAFLRAWAAEVDDPALRCAWLAARLDTEPGAIVRPDWSEAARVLWRSGTTPSGCAPVFLAFTASPAISDDDRWQRVLAAAKRNDAATVRAASAGLPAADAAQATAYAAFLAAPDARAATWPANARSRAVAVAGLVALGKRDADAATALLGQLAGPLQLDDADRGAVLAPIALRAASNFSADAAARLAAVPAAGFDATLRGWQVREALARSDWEDALAAIQAMPATQRNGSQWRYLEGRLRALTGDAAGAERAWQEAAKQPNFYGFLAADRIGAPYALCPLATPDDATLSRQVAATPALQRAFDLHQIGHDAWAEAEWASALADFTPLQRVMAVALAQHVGWYDRAVFALGQQNPEELRLYTLRFPIAHERSIARAAARHALDPAWINAEIRAESLFDPEARSRADARGLMQVLPGTGAQLAASEGLPWLGGDSLFDADTNIALGSAYLRQLLDRYDGRPWLAIASYNAGPAPVARWQAARPGLDPDLWIETIGYRETREYVPRVLAFSVLYDWRLNGDALPLSARLSGTPAPRKRFVCPTEPAATTAR